jgi:hypothetical protein
MPFRRSGTHVLTRLSHTQDWDDLPFNQLSLFAEFRAHFSVDLVASWSQIRSTTRSRIIEHVASGAQHTLAGLWCRSKSARQLYLTVLFELPLELYHFKGADQNGLLSNHQNIRWTRSHTEDASRVSMWDPFTYSVLIFWSTNNNKRPRTSSAGALRTEQNAADLYGGRAPPEVHNVFKVACHDWTSDASHSNILILTIFACVYILLAWSWWLIAVVWKVALLKALQRIPLRSITQQCVRLCVSYWFSFVFYILNAVYDVQNVRLSRYLCNWCDRPC